MSVSSIAPRSRLILFGQRDRLSRVGKANSENMDFGARDLEDAYIELYEERDRFYREIAEDALKFAAENGSCDVLTFVEEEKRTFDEFADELIQKFGKDCLLQTPDEALNIAEERINDEDYPGAVNYLIPLLDDKSCDALEIVISNQGKSRTMANLIEEFSGLLEVCEDNHVIALENLARNMESNDRQALFDKADELCVTESVLGACPIAASMLMDRENKLDQQTAKTSFNAPGLVDLRKDAVAVYLLPAAKSGDAESALVVIKMTLIDKLDGTGFFTRDAEALIEKLNKDRNSNGMVLKLVRELKIKNPADVLNNVGKLFSGDAKRQCEELSGYQRDQNLEEFVVEEMESVLTGATCGPQLR